MQNLSLNEFKQTDRMNSLRLDELKQIAITRHITNYKDISKEDLLIALLKSNKRNAELLNNKSNNMEARKTKKLFNKLKNKFSEDEINKITAKINKKECIYNYLKHAEQKDTLPKKQKKVLIRIEEYFRKLQEDLNKLKSINTMIMKI